MKQRKWLSRMAATAAAMATLLTGGVVAGTALAADTDEPGLTASKTVTATDKPNVFDVNLSATAVTTRRTRSTPCSSWIVPGRSARASTTRSRTLCVPWAGV